MDVCMTMGFGNTTASPANGTAAVERPELKITRPELDFPYTAPTPLATRIARKTETETLSLPSPSHIDAKA